MAKKWISACLNGQGDYAGKAYFFKDDQYVRYDWPSDRAEFGTQLTAPAWNLPPLFATNPDGVLEGRGDYAGKAYFFKGNQYVRYDWAGNRMDAGYPQPSSAWGLTGAFAGGIDACLNGEEAYAGKIYFFKGDQYVRGNWTTGRVETSPRPLVGNWPGLHELLAAGVAKNEAVRWMATAHPQVVAYLATVQTGAPYGFNRTLMEQALRTHFKLSPALTPAQRAGYLAAIVQTMTNVEQQWLGSAELFRARTNAEAVADGAVGKDGTPVKAYYMDSTKRVNFSENYVKAGTGPKYQAAIVTHETVHAVDSVSGVANNHIPEWFTSGTKDADLPKYYQEQTADEAVHNPSSYAAFSQHLFFGDDRRYGAGRPTE